MKQVKQPHAKKEQPYIPYEQRGFGSGSYADFQTDGSLIPDNAVVKAYNVLCYPMAGIVRPGTELWTELLQPNLPGREDYVATKTGKIITKTAGTVDFSAADVGNFFYWPVSGRYDEIVGIIGADSVQVLHDTDETATTMEIPGAVCGPENAQRIWDEYSGKLYAFFDTRVFWTDYTMSAWTQVYLRSPASADLPISTYSNFNAYKNFVALFNDGRLFIIDTYSEPLEMWKANANVPAFNITENAQTDILTYSRRYLKAMARISGNGNRNRGTDGARIQHESGSNTEDADTLRDYREIWTDRPIGPNIETYQKLTLCQWVLPISEFNNITQSYRATDGSGGFRIYLNGIACDVVLNGLNTVPDYEALASIIQNAVRTQYSYIAPFFECKYEGGRITMVTSTMNGSTISRGAGFEVLEEIPAPDTYQVLDCAWYPPPTLAYFQTAVNGQFLVTINGVTYGSAAHEYVTGLNTASSMELVAQRIQDAVRAWGATDFLCWWDGSKFHMTGGVIAGNTISFLSTKPTGPYADLSGSFYLCARSTYSIYGAAIQTHPVIPSVYNQLAGYSIINTNPWDAILEDINVSAVSTLYPLTPPADSFHWTHHTLYGTLNMGVDKGTNKPNIYAWVEDVPVIKALDAYRDNADGHIHISPGGNGTFEPMDAHSPIRFADGTTDYLGEYIGATEMTGSGVLVGVLGQGAAIGAVNVMTASQSGYIVTRTDGSLFTTAAIGRELYFANGRRAFCIAFISANQVRVEASAEYPAQGCAYFPTTRYFADTVSDIALEGRQGNHSLIQRFWTHIEDFDAGILTSGFLICGRIGEKEIKYQALIDTKEYIIGYHNTSYQKKALKGVLVGFSEKPDRVIVYCKQATAYFVPAHSRTTRVPVIEIDVTVLADLTYADTVVGARDPGGILSIPGGIDVIFTNEPNLRIFDGSNYGAPLATDENGLGRVLETLISMHTRVVLGYDPVLGVLIWGYDANPNT